MTHHRRTTALLNALETACGALDGFVAHAPAWWIKALSSNALVARSVVSSATGKVQATSPYDYTLPRQNTIDTPNPRSVTQAFDALSAHEKLAYQAYHHQAYTDAERALHALLNALSAFPALARHATFDIALYMRGKRSEPRVGMRFNGHALHGNGTSTTPLQWPALAPRLGAYLDVLAPIDEVPTSTWLVVERDTLDDHALSGFGRAHTRVRANSADDALRQDRVLRALQMDVSLESPLGEQRLAIHVPDLA